MERFKDDTHEAMSKKGMGAIYTKDSDGIDFIKLDRDYKQMVLSNYYDKHHDMLNKFVSEILDMYPNCYIIDLHSFSDEFVKRVLGLSNNPDVCVGFDEEFKDRLLVEKTIDHFQKYGYSVNINYPYNGSLVPNEYWNRKDDRIKSIMIEINKRIYLDDNTFLHEEKAKVLKRCMNDYYKNIIGLK